MFPTPTTSDWKGGSGTVKEKDGKYYRQSDKTGVKWGVKLDALIEYQYRTTLPTPTAKDWKDNGKSPAELARKSKTQATHAGGQLNPTWVEWLMGFPIGWTDLNS